MRDPALIAACLLLVLQAGAARGQGLTYDVGPGQPLLTLSDVPWESLLPGDTVLVHWQASPYRDKWVITRSGTQADPITVRGLPGPAGERPVVSGDGAVTRRALDFWNEVRGVIKIGGASVPADLTPEWIVIEGLEVRSAHPNYSFLDDGGNSQTYAGNAAAIYVEKGRHLTIRDCELHDSGNGLFIGSPDADPTIDVLIERNELHGNGNVGSAFEHNSYTEALGITFQENLYRSLRPGADGNNLKDRSAGLVVRYNWIEGGNRQLDLVNAGAGSAVEQDPSYRLTQVYGNVLIEPEGAGNRQMVHYGGDSGNEAEYRKGLLLFHHNTVVSERIGRSTLFRLSSNEERCDARNNVVFLPNASGDQLELVSDAGVLDWTHDFLEPGWSFSFFGTLGTFNDAGTTVEGSDPGFVDAATNDFELRADAACRDAGTVLASAADPVLREPVAPRSSRPRPDDGLPDIGAHEHATAIPLPGEALDLRLAGQELSWTPAPDAAEHEIARGELSPLAAAGLAASSLDCLSGLAGTSLVDAETAGPAGRWYLVRGRNPSGAGTWGSAVRDAALSPSPCP